MLPGERAKQIPTAFRTAPCNSRQVCHAPKTVAILELIYANEGVTWTTILTAPAAELALPADMLAEPMARPKQMAAIKAHAMGAGEGDRSVQDWRQPR
jgi:hypothetical protein